MASASDSAELRVSKLSSGTPSPTLMHALWPALFVALYWLAYAGIGLVDQPMFTTFLWRIGLMLLLTVTMSIWWLANRRIGWIERIAVPIVAIASAAVATLFLHKSVLPPSVLIPTGQALITAWAIWYVITLAAPPTLRMVGLIAMGVLFWVPMTQVRMEGLRGDGGADLFWRSTPTAEEKLLAELKTAPPAESPPATPVDDNGETKVDEEAWVATADDWPEFRGANRNGIVLGQTIRTNWNESPPKEIWRKPVGPAWSSVAIVGDWLFTQEQRGPQEVVVAYKSATGEQVWADAIEARFEESLGGIGPRATPTFADGLIFAQGASGWLSCLDAKTGGEKWRKNIAEIAGTDLPVWGYSSSPLVSKGVVVTFAGNKPKKDRAAGATPGLLAFHVNGGDVAWHADIGKESYSSPQRYSLGDTEQVLYLSDTQLVSFTPASGDKLWEFKNPGSGRPTVQPQFVTDNQLAISFLPDNGVTLLKLDSEVKKPAVSEVWASRNMKPDFSDYVHHAGYLYGFDNDLFCCISLADGKRMWKKGRYGAGQVLLLEKQPVLLVITERGEVVLVAMNPKKHEELAKFQAINGKTWNHPVVSQGRLYVRNAEEMACFDVAPK